MENKTNSVVPASSTEQYLDGLFIVDSEGRLVVDPPSSDIDILPSWELSDNDLKFQWMSVVRRFPELLAEELAKWPTRDLDALRASLKGEYEQFCDEDRQWQKDQQDSVDGL